MNVVKIEPFFKSTVQAVEEIGTSETTGVKGVNKSFKMHLDDGNDYLWKPKNGEHVSSWRYVPPKTLYKREKAAYLADRLLGFNMVPKVKIEKYKGDIGSLQYWVDDCSPADATLKTYSNEDIWKSGLFDLIIGQTDRHSGNWLTKLNRPILIDNGFAFPNYAAENDGKSVILSRFAFAIWDHVIPEKYISAMQKLLNSDILNRYLDSNSIGLMHERIGTMLERRRASFPKYRVIKKLDKVPKTVIKSINKLLEKI